MRILLLEDDLSMRFFLKTLLDQDFEIALGKDGLEGMQCLLAGAEPDLIIIGLSMFGKDGLVFLRQLSISEFYGNIPVVVIGSQKDQTCMKQCLELGVKAFFIKPFDPQKFHNKIQQVLQPSPVGGNAFMD